MKSETIGYFFLNQSSDKPGTQTTRGSTRTTRGKQSFVVSIKSVF